MYTSLQGDPFERSIKTLRKQLDAFSPEILESARQHYASTTETKLLKQQQFQCAMVGQLEKMLRADAESGTFVAAGGHESGVYESFFRVCPGRYMSKSVFQYALVRVFGAGSGSNSVALVDSTISKLYDTFDPSAKNEMDWRCFLCLLVIVVQPLLSCTDHLRYMFAFYASYGDLDLSCPSRLTLGVIKDFMSFTVSVPLRLKMRSLVQSAWDELYTKASKLGEHIELKANPDDILISHGLFEKILATKVFHPYLGRFRPFGITDKSAWLYQYEEEFYCPSLVKTLRIRRREARNNVEVARFRDMVVVRHKKIIFHFWVAFVRRRFKARVFLMWYDAQKRFSGMSKVFDRWRKLAIADHCARVMQRVVRGFIGRSRMKITREVIRRSVVLQAVSRKAQQRKKYSQLRDRRYWAVITVQRHFRGYLGRCRVRSIVLALYDAGRRKLEREMEAFYAARKVNAVTCCQRFWRWCKRRKDAVQKMRFKMQLDATHDAMARTVYETRLKKIAFQQALAEWYRQRKLDYDMSRMREDQTAQEKAKIASYRRRQKDADKEEMKRLRLLREEEAENKRIEDWIAMWDKEVIVRKERKFAQCNRAMDAPTNSEEVKLRAEIKKRAKKHIKVVLRKADTQKVPMEIPEATLIAAKEIIDEIVLAEGVLVKEEMRAAAEEYELNKIKEAEAEKEAMKEDRKRRRGWAVQMLLAFARSYLSRKALRLKAYARYKKFFDASTANYYYMDLKTEETFWEKPKALGAYDVDVMPGWVVMHDTEGDPYYYDPKTWTMSAHVPRGCALCDVCSSSFAVARLLSNDTNYCEIHFDQKVGELLEAGVPDHKIIFKAFAGNMEGSTDNDYAEFDEQSWKGYCEGQDILYKESHTDKGADVDGEGSGPVCTTCMKAFSQRSCDQCLSSYCIACYDTKHAKPPWTLHTFSPVTK